MTEISELLKRVEAGERSNELDMAIEIALFNPDVAIRANAAGTKLIYTKRDGTEQTHLADDWTLKARQSRTLATLRALSITQAEDGKDG